jgi:type IV pilus assembly protein PilY1
MKIHPSKSLLVITALLFSGAAPADDIELFAGLGTSTDAPNVMFVLDNAANFSASVTTMRCSITAEGVVDTTGAGASPTNLDRTAGAVEQCALYSALSALAASTTARFNIGVMGFNANGMKQFNPTTNSFSASCVGGTGGCLLMPLTPYNTANKANILAWIRNWAISGGSDHVMKGDNTASGAVMQETWAYYKGKTGVSGRNYADDAPDGVCANKYVIFVGNAYRNNSTPGDSTNEASSPLKPLNGTSADANKRADPAATAAQKAVITGTINTECGTSTLQTAENKGAYALNWARYMKAQDITSYSIGVLGPTCNAEYAAHLTKLGAADVGGGKFFGTNSYDELKAAIETALNEIQSVNSVFASVSLPVSVNTEGSYLNQVYIGMFRPAANFMPRWPGNLKQYRLGYVSGVLKLLDAQTPGQPAISAADTGFIAECAQSYWTPSTDDTYWTPFTEANCSPHAASSNSPDGNIVEKGAQAYKLRGSPTATSITREVKTCSDSNCTALGTFGTANTSISKAALGDAAMSDTDRTNLIDWQRGVNNKAEDETFAAATAVRPSVHGDIVHSRPVAINYGTGADSDTTGREVVVYYGANDGMLHAINGNRNDGLDVGGKGPGEELWSFVPPEFYSRIERLRENTVSIDYLGGGVAGAQPKAYGMDGTITAYSGDVSGTEKTFIYATMRRGGRTFYAFDVTTPGSPSLKFRIGCPNSSDDVGCTTGFSEMGQTWSAVKVFKIAADSGAEPRLVMGGGYDTCEDADPNGCSSGTKGDRIYVINGNDDPSSAPSALEKAFSTDRAVIAEVFVVNDASGYAKWLYAADLGGNIYRISGVDANTPIGTTLPADWTITKIAALGCATPSSCADNRKFMFIPDVIESQSGRYSLLLGSGDREKPLTGYTHAYGVSNYFFRVDDEPLNSSWLSSENANCGADILCLASLQPILTSATPTDADLAAKKGWYLGLSAHEQVVTSAITVYGTVTFSTHQAATAPDPGVCVSNLGTTMVYNVNYANAAALPSVGTRAQEVKGGGLPPSPVAGLVVLDDGTTAPFIIGSNPESPLEGGEPPSFSTFTQPRGRVYWYIEQQ